MKVFKKEFFLLFGKKQMSFLSLKIAFILDRFYCYHFYLKSLKSYSFVIFYFVSQSHYSILISLPSYLMTFLGTTNALTVFHLHILNCSNTPSSYIRVLAIDFLKAFDKVSHAQLLEIAHKNFHLPHFTLKLSLIHIWRCRRSTLCRSRWSPYH